MKICENGKACADIVLAECPTETERYAAQELKKYLLVATRADISVVAEGKAKATSHIYVGKTESAMQRFASEYERLPQDGFVVKTSGEDLYLFGKENDFSTAATLYAVYDFLEKYVGVRFYAVDEEYIPQRESLEIFQANEREAPDFLVRQPLFATQRKHGDFAAKLRIKDCYTKDIPGGALDPCWGTTQGHNFFTLIPPAKYEEAHPEWFDKENGQLCFSQDSLADELTEVLKGLIDSHPNSKYFALSQNDTVNPCQCEKCKKNYEKYGVTGTMMRFVNRVAKNIEVWAAEKYPNREIYIVTFAYYFSIKPPVVKTVQGEFQPIDESCVPNPNVYIFFTTIDFCFYHPLDDARCEWNKEFSDIFYGWKSLVGNRMLVWSYGANYAHYLYPFFNFDTLRRNYRFFKDNGLSELILEHGSCEAEHVEMEELRVYLTSKLMWNVNVDLEKEGKEFIRGYYKACAPCVEEYLKLLRKRFAQVDQERGYHLRLYHLPEDMFSAENFPIEFLEELKAIFESGFAQAEKIQNPDEREKVKARLLRVSLSARFLLLMNYDKYGLEGKEEFVDRYVADARACQIKRWKEYWQTEDNMDDLKEKAKKGEVLKY